MRASSRVNPSEVISVRGVPLEGAHWLEVSNTTRLWKMFHESYGVCGVTAGASTVRYRQRDVALGPGSLFLVEPGENHATTRVLAPGDFDAIFFPTALVKEILQDAAPKPPHLRRSVVSHKALFVAFQKALAMLRAGADEGAAREQLALALLRVFRHASEGPALRDVRDAARVHRAAQVLRDAYEAAPWQPVNVAAVASELGMSYYHLVHRFSREMGLAPYQYVQKLRLSKLPSLLLSGPKENLRSLTDIAAVLGFSDKSHLHRSVLREYGLTPGRIARDLNPAWG